MEIDISRGTAVRAMTMASTSVIDVTMIVVGIMRGSTGGVTEMSTGVLSGGTTVSEVAVMMAVTAVVEVKMRLSDSAVAGEVTAEAIAEVRAGFASVGATLVVADIMVKSWGVDLRTSSVTTIAEVAAMMGVAAVVEVKMRLSDSTAASEGTAVAISSTRVTELNTVEGVLLLLTVNGGLLDSTLEAMGSMRSLGSAEAVSGRSRDVRAEAVSGRSTDVEATLARSADVNTRSAESSLSRGTSGLGERAGRSSGSVSVMEGSRGTTVVRCVAGRSTITVGAPFSSGSSGNNSSESESLEHLTKKYIKSIVPNLL